ncbi:hypothetical protein [Aeromicrobium ginsengisoli]|uniref:Ig-like domain-containing protein n=1 Tax=Aeromicrobium ginsengisoli TaxID=363867 RepID=A0A5M4FBN5_9ACTN|nr:hypothetical protein [Aeromicrobium ginsengisoli]KAA1395788.1 hypothetical protein ESP70_016755 [Aeromicrobium ginsengisoli]
MNILHTRSLRRAAALLLTAVCVVGVAPSSARAADPDPTGIDLGSLLCRIGLGSMVNTAPPTISGTVKVASTLTASPGTWSPTGATYTYQWLADGAPVTEATASPTYVVPGGAVGKKLSVKVTAYKCMKNPGAATSAQTVAVPALTNLGYAVPTITGTPKVGQTLTANEGAWTPDGITFTYKWLAEGTAIAGATAKTYVPTAAEVGKRIQVTVSGSKAGYLTTFVTSQATAAVVPAVAVPVANTVAPTISGTPKVGQTLTVSPGTWTPTGVTFTYQWLADGVAITGATGTSFTPGTSRAGTKLSVAVTGSKTGYASATVTTAQTAPLAQLDQLGYATPTITGTAKVGQTLTANEGAWTPDGITFTYQWYSEGVLVAGATAKTYVPTAADLNKRIQVRVTGAKTGYLTTFATSAPTVRVVAAG